jgi:hypothetical protein
MPVPPFNAEGLLPAGIHIATRDEIRERFGVFRGSDRRLVLFARLLEFVSAVRRSNLFEALLIDGSFVTAKPDPNDIDIIAVLRPGHDFERDLPMSEYAVVSRAMLARRFRFDVVIAERGSGVYVAYLEFFSLVRDVPGVKKGMLQITP